MAKLTPEELSKLRSDNMKKVRAEWYEDLTEEEKFAFRSKGGKSVVNRHKFTSEAAKKAAKARWDKK
jgi:hypothetical protein